MKHPAIAADLPAIVKLLTVDQTSADTFCGRPVRRASGRLFGGLVAAQALVAASHSVENDLVPHSLHAYFLRPGRDDEPVDYVVERTREGRSFSTRRVQARQQGTAIFETLLSFQRPEPGADWSSAAPYMPEPPRTSTPALPPRLRHLNGLLDLRQVHPGAPGWNIYPYWFRSLPPIGDDPVVNAAVLTYVSDIAFMANAREPGTRVEMAVAASIDHALWFHRPTTVDDWHLFASEPIANVGTRGTVRGEIRRADGTLVATAVQEALLRPAD